MVVCYGGQGAKTPGAIRVKDYMCFQWVQAQQWPLNKLGI